MLLGNQFAGDAPVSAKVTSAEAGDHQIEVRNHGDVLAAGSQRLESVNHALLVRVINDPPQIAIFSAAQIIDWRGSAPQTRDLKSSGPARSRRLA